MTLPIAINAIPNGRFSKTFTLSESFCHISVDLGNLHALLWFVSSRQ